LFSEFTSQTECVLNQIQNQSHCIDGKKIDEMKKNKIPLIIHVKVYTTPIKHCWNNDVTYLYDEAQEMDSWGLSINWF